MILKEFQIRAATNLDIPSIKNVVFSSLREFGLNPEENGKDKDLNDIENSYQSQNGFFGVVVRAETNLIAGCFGLFPLNDNICELRKMYLLKETTAIFLYKKYGFKEIEPREINARVDQAFELDIEP
jgi:hypothetical protein